MNGLSWVVLASLALLGLLSAMQSTLVNARRGRLNELFEDGRQDAGRLIAILEDSASWRLTLRIARTVARLVAIGAAALAWLPPALSGAASLPGGSVLAVVALVLGGTAVVLAVELLPEAWAARNPEDWALRLLPVTVGLRWGLASVVGPLMWLDTQFDLPLHGYAPVEMTSETLLTMIETSEDEDGFEADERKLLVGVLGFSDTLAREIMIPRIDVMALDVNTPMAETLERVVKANYSRIPVYEQSIDNIQGVLLVKDLLDVWYAGDADRPLRSLLRPPYFVPETKRLTDLLAEMQSRRIHMAIVVDEFGGMAGIVTLEDIVEEIIGEVQDEYDDDEELPYTQTGEDAYLVTGGMDLDDLNELLHSRLDSEGVETIGGLILEQLGRVPQVGEQLAIGGVQFEIKAVSGRRIRWVQAWREVGPETPIEERDSDA